MIGTSVSHYKILQKLGEGGMGVVYKAEDTKLRRTVALKFLPERLEVQEADRARFLHEAQAASALNHPNICAIHAFGEHEGQQFIDMEFVNGITLRQKMQGERLPLTETIAYALQVGEALQEAHQNGIIHRDIKPENIMLNAKNQIKVMDFGLAKLKGSLKLTKTSSTVGTLAYMAPEQIQGGEADARSDIFSFGIVLYEMVAGHLPFRGEHEAALIYSIVNEDPEPLQKYRQDLPPELLHINGKVLEKDPEERYQTVHEMLIDLRRLKKHSTKVVRPAASALPAAGTAPVEEKRPKLKNPLTILGAALILLLIIAVLVLKPLFRGGETAEGTHPFQSYRPMRMATAGKPYHAALSPDGKYIVYSMDEAGKRSLWMRQVSAASTIRILPPMDVNYLGFTFSPDGDYIYYSTSGSSDVKSSLSVVPTLGGSPRKLLEDIQSPAAVSPDGKQLSFLREYSAEGEGALIVCSADGSDQRKLLTARGEDFLTGLPGIAPAWSPDGTTIACPIGSSRGMYMSVALVSVSDGSSRLATTFRWDVVYRIAWGREGKSLVLIADERFSAAGSQVWYIDLPSGWVHRITNDLNKYDGATLSLTSDQTKLLVLPASTTTSVFILPEGDSRRARQITSPTADMDGVRGLDWTPDGRLLFTSFSNGQWDISIMNADGGERRQLTSTSWNEGFPSVSRDGRSIAYQSDRDTTPHIWRMDIDGSSQRKLTAGDLDDYSPRFSSDGRWIYFDSYRNGGRRNIWKVPAGGGDPEQASDAPIITDDISRDSKLAAVSYYDSAMNHWREAILSLESGKPLSFMHLPATGGSPVRWMPDGRAIAYTDTRNDVSNLWALPLESGKPYQLTHFDSQSIAYAAWSKDGKYLALVRGIQTGELVILAEAK